MSSSAWQAGHSSEPGPGLVIASTSTVHQALSNRPPIAGMPGAEDRIWSAVSLLTSRPENLSAADWRPWHASTRRYRLVTQPLAVLPDDSIVIAPSYCTRSATVYDLYLTQGKLPWSEEPPPTLRMALAAWREQRNSQLEKDVASTLEALGYNCMTRISKSRQLGVPSLAGEEDVVAGLGRFTRDLADRGEDRADHSPCRRSADIWRGPTSPTKRRRPTRSNSPESTRIFGCTQTSLPPYAEAPGRPRNSRTRSGRSATRPTCPGGVREWPCLLRHAPGPRENTHRPGTGQNREPIA